MIIIDRRQGSGDLAKSWKEATLGDLSFADVAVMGQGPDGVPMRCGIEIKTLPELMGDLYTNRFLGHQVPGLQRSYDYIWLVVEGRHKRGDDGQLLVPRKLGWRQVTIGQKPIMHATALTLIATIAQKAGIRVWPTENRTQTLAFCKGLAHWWTQGWDSHQSVDTFHQPKAPGHVPHEHSLLRLWLKEIRGIGWVRSAEAENQFTSALDMATANAKRWAAVKGISKKRAQAIVREIGKLS